MNYFKRPATQLFLQLISLAIGAFSAAVGLLCFLVPNQLIDGGVMGIALLLNEVSSLPLAVLIIGLNLPLLLFSRNKSLILKGSFGVICLSLGIRFIHLPAFEGDLILAALAGGVLLGTGIGLAIRNSGVLDGSEILAIAFHQRFGLSVGKTILFINSIIFFISSFFLPLENVLFSVITYLSATRVVDFIVYGLEEMAGVMIFSSHFKKIKTQLLHEGDVGVSIINGKTGIAESDHSVLYCVVNRLDLHKVQYIVYREDPSSFLVVQPVTHVQGGFVRRVFKA